MWSTNVMIEGMASVFVEQMCTVFSGSNVNKLRALQYKFCLYCNQKKFNRCFCEQIYGVPDLICIFFGLTHDRYKTLKSCIILYKYYYHCYNHLWHSLKQEAFIYNQKISRVYFDCTGRFRKLWNRKTTLKQYLSVFNVVTTQ